MEYHWLRCESDDKLVIFVLGWAADQRLVEHIRPEGCDLLAVYDYGEGFAADDRLCKIATGYLQVYLFAWSFGVWAAEQLLRDVPLTRAVAFNGTPYPVDELYGIEPRRMAVTIRGLKSGGMDAFHRRTYGEYYDHFLPIMSPRSLEHNISELEYLAAESVVEYTPSIKWDKAIIGSHDEIFPPENMVRFWGSRAEILPLPHYPFADSKIIEKEIECR